MNRKKVSRRGFLGILSWLGSLGTVGGISWASVRYMIPNILYEPPKSYKIGRPGDYPVGVNFIAEKRIFVVRRGDSYKVVSAVCSQPARRRRRFPGTQQLSRRTGDSSWTSGGSFLTPPR